MPKAVSWQSVAQISPLPYESVWSYDSQQQVLWFRVAVAEADAEADAERDSKAAAEDDAAAAPTP